MRDPRALMVPVKIVTVRCEVLLLEKASATIFYMHWLVLSVPGTPISRHETPPPRSEPFTKWLPASRSPRPGPCWGDGARLSGRSDQGQQRRLQRGGVTARRSWYDTTARLRRGARRARFAPLPLCGLGAALDCVTARETLPSANSAMPQGALEARWT